MADVAGKADYDELIYEVSDHIATITLNAPERMNTISGPMLDGLSALLLKADADRNVRAIILTGAGRAFCAGLNLEAATSGQSMESNAISSGHLDLKNTPPTILFNMDTPTICAINGGAAGYGMDTALGCDIRVMSDKAKMAAAFTKRGVVPESGGTTPRFVKAAAIFVRHIFSFYRARTDDKQWHYKVYSSRRILHFTCFYRETFMACPASTLGREK